MIAERIKHLLDQKGWTPAELSRRTLVPQPTIHRILRGESRSPRRENIEAIAKALACPIEYLWSGEPSASASDSIAEKEFERMGSLLGPVRQVNDPEMVSIPIAEERDITAGKEHVSVTHTGTRPILSFGKKTLELHGVQANKAVAVTVRGNSMEPVLPDGSTVAVNTAEKDVIDGKIYALVHDGLLRVKTLYRLPGGGLRLRSFNGQEHADEEYTAAELKEQELDVMGRVFWSQAFR